MGRFVYIKENKTKAYQPGHWKLEKKMEAVALWCSTGSPTIVCKQLGIPMDTIKLWKTQDWWKDAVESIRNGENDILDSKLTKALDKALDSVMDRLENGEYIYDQKTGKIKQTPVKLRDANTVLNSLIDKRQLLRKLPTKIVESVQTEQKLQQLAQQFADFTGKILKEKEEKVIEYIENDTVVQTEDGTYEVK